MTAPAPDYRWQTETLELMEDVRREKAKILRQLAAIDRRIALCDEQLRDLQGALTIYQQHHNQGIDSNEPGEPAG